MTADPKTVNGVQLVGVANPSACHLLLVLKTLTCT